MRILDDLSSKHNPIIGLTAGRGRGKSAAMGLALSGAV